MRAAALQFSAAPFDLTRNLEASERLARQAVGQGAQVIVLPELFNTGYVYTPRLFVFAETEGGLTLTWLRQLSLDLKAYLAGTLLLRQPEGFFNVFVLVEPDGTVHKYRTQCPFLWERCYFDAGREPLIAETSLGRIGLMACWDITRPALWESYRGGVDLLLVASAAPRLHRAVINFPLGRKVYLAQLMPELLRAREAMDGWYLGDVARRARWLSAPIVHAAMAGRFVTEVPFPRFSYLAAAWARPRYWPLVVQAHLASLRATFYGTSAVFDAQGDTLARVEAEQGIALADIPSGAPPPASAQAGEVRPMVPRTLRLLERLLRPVATRYYRRNRVLE